MRNFGVSDLKLYLAGDKDQIIIVPLCVYKRFVKKYEAFQLYYEFWLE